MNWGVFGKRKGKEPRSPGYVAALEFFTVLNRVTGTLIIVSLITLGMSL